MAITITKERKRQRYLVLALVAMIFITFALLWLRFFRKPQEPALLPPAPVVYALREIPIDWRLLEEIGGGISQPFKAISGFGEDFGRENPFVPY